MDLLSSLGLDTLPEQSTRLSHPGVLKALDSAAAGEDVRLGFNACLRCGVRLAEDGAASAPRDASAPSRAVACRACGRVRYCSKACRAADAAADPEGDPTPAVGHSPVVCALLGLCDADDAAEAQEGQRDAAAARTTDQRSEAARDRVRTERESYPATLFGALAEGPDWLAAAIAPRRRRRGQRERAAAPSVTALTLHVVGASADAELWHDGGTGIARPALEAYAEAAGGLARRLRKLLPGPATLRCVFVGPDCPATVRATAPIPDAPSWTLALETVRARYGEAGGPHLPPPDAVAFFNPGFSCPDYDWASALAAAAAAGPVPFLVATNTEMEGVADIRCLLDSGGGRLLDAATVPADVLAAADHPRPAAGSPAARSGDDEEEGGTTPFFFGPNPYAGWRVRQSGTMGNDLYVKNSWIVGGLFQGGGGSNVPSSGEECAEPQARAEKRRRRSEDVEDDGGETQPPKRQNNGENVNTKRTNPALI